MPVNYQDLTNQAGKLDPGQSIGGSKEEFAFPTLAGTLAGSGAGLQGAASQELLALLRDPTANPGYQASLQGVLESLRGAEEQGYQDLSDQFRKAGAMQSGAYGTSLAKFAGENARTRTIAASDVLSKLLPTLVQGFQGPAMQAPDLLNSIKQRSAFDLSNAAQPKSGGGGTGYIGSTTRPGAPSQAPQTTLNYGSSLPSRF